MSYDPSDVAAAYRRYLYEGHGPTCHLLQQPSVASFIRCNASNLNTQLRTNIMLPKYLQSSYTRYKDDTNSFATWLLEAATKCGHRPDGLASIPPSLKKGKGKGRSKAKSKNDGANASTEPIQYNATIKELQILAEVVAKSTLVVPKQILVIAKRAIKLRRQVTSWFFGQGDSENNKHHEHFISALEKVCETLEWKISESANKDARKPPPEADYDGDDADLDMFLNRFAVLTVEEPQKSELSQHASPESQQIVQVELVENEQEEKDAADAVLAYTLFKTRDPKGI